MNSPPPALTDRDALARHRERALKQENRDFFLHALAMDEIKERLALVKRRFTRPLIVTGFPEVWQDFMPEATVIEDKERLSIKQCEHDLVIHAMSLHWSNDPVGQIVQSRLALEPDGLFIAATFGGGTLSELRAAMAMAESAVSGGLSPRIAPMAEIRELGGLLQRGGLAMPVADSLTQTVTYASLRDLMLDLRRMGETNALAARVKTPVPRQLFDQADQVYSDSFGLADGRIPATFELIFLSAWSPHPDQPLPLRPGSASHSLAETLEKLRSETRD